MKARPAVVALAMLAAGCASTGTEPTPIDPLPPTYAAPSPIEGRDWHLTQYWDQSTLAFGVAESEPSMLSDGQILTTEVGADEAVLRSFRSLGWLASWTGDAREGYAPQPGSEGNIERFFAACG